VLFCFYFPAPDPYAFPDDQADGYRPTLRMSLRTYLPVPPVYEDPSSDNEMQLCK
jgi:hypothetical protein